MHVTTYFHSALARLRAKRRRGWSRSRGGSFDQGLTRGLHLPSERAMRKGAWSTSGSFDLDSSKDAWSTYGSFDLGSSNDLYPWPAVRNVFKDAGNGLADRLTEENVEDLPVRMSEFKARLSQVRTRAVKESQKQSEMEQNASQLLTKLSELKIRGGMETRFGLSGMEASSAHLRSSEMEAPLANIGFSRKGPFIGKDAHSTESAAEIISPPSPLAAAPVAFPASAQHGSQALFFICFCCGCGPEYGEERVACKVCLTVFCPECTMMYTSCPACDPQRMKLHAEVAVACTFCGREEKEREEHGACKTCLEFFCVHCRMMIEACPACNPQVHGRRGTTSIKWKSKSCG